MLTKKKTKADRETLVKKKKVKRNQNLPNEIIESNILTRLPVKTLIRFTTACKSWYSLFSDPYFINIHHQIQTKKKSNLLLVDYNHDDLVVIKDSCFSPEHCWSSFFNDTAGFKEVNVIGCYNGIVCVSWCIHSKSAEASDHHICLWNPALRSTKVISSKVIASYTRRGLFAFCVGFSYHNETNDYNVIIFSNEEYSLKDVEIYSSNLDSWRKINFLVKSKKLIENVFVEMIGVYVSCYPGGGAYCWLAYDEDENVYQESWIMSFDMEDEAFKAMMLPYDTSTGEHTIFIYKDSLAVLHTYVLDYSNRPITTLGNIWVMKEYHDPQSWTKLYSFDFLRIDVSFMGVVDVSFMGVVENDLIRLSCEDLKITYEPPIIKEMRVVNIDKSPVNTTTCPKIINFLTKARRVCSFTESLNSLGKLKGVDSKNNSSD